jgi:hypothetical protein
VLDDVPDGRVKLAVNGVLDDVPSWRDGIVTASIAETVIVAEPSTLIQKAAVHRSHCDSETAQNSSSAHDGHVATEGQATQRRKRVFEMSWLFCTRDSDRPLVSGHELSQLKQHTWSSPSYPKMLLSMK